MAIRERHGIERGNQHGQDDGVEGDEMARPSLSNPKARGMVRIHEGRLAALQNAVGNAIQRDVAGRQYGEGKMACRIGVYRRNQPSIGIEDDEGKQADQQCDPGIGQTATRRTARFLKRLHRWSTVTSHVCELSFLFPHKRHGAGQWTRAGGRKDG